MTAIGMNPSLKAAVSRARAHAATAVLAASLVPLGAANATDVVPVSVTFQQDTSGPSVVNSFTFTNNDWLWSTSTYYPLYPLAITHIEIPEFHSGDLNFSTLPSNWTATEVSAAQLLGATPIKDGSAAAYFVELTASSPAYGITSGNSLTFDAIVPTAATTGADLGFYGVIPQFGPPYAFNSTYVVDPLIPDTRSAPEPSTIAVLGTAVGAMAATRRRRAARQRESDDKGN